MCLPVKPYKVEREWSHAGLQCAVVQARQCSNRCGYVRVPPTHPAHGKDYDAVDIDVHGGLTFSSLEPCSTNEDGQGFWFGFDCAHFGDATIDPQITLENAPTPELRKLLEINLKYPIRGEEDDHFWTQLEVERETERLAEQLAHMEAIHAH